MTPEKFEAFKKSLTHLFGRKLVVSGEDVEEKINITIMEDEMVDKLTKEAIENPEYFEDSDRSWADYQ